MSNYDNTNKGAIWGNKDKKSEKHPDLKGSINVEGVEYWVSAWRRGPNDNPNAPALKFAITAKEQVHQQGVQQAQQAAAPAPEMDNFDDSIPF